MPTPVTIKTSAKPSSGAELVESYVLNAESVNKVSVVIPIAAIDKVVQIYGGLLPALQYLLIKSSAYHATDLSYKVGPTGVIIHKLTSFHSWNGTGQCGVIEENPTQIRVTNATGAEVTLDILVAADVTP